MKVCVAFVVSVVLGACGGSSKSAATEPAPASETTKAPAAHSDCVSTCIADGGAKAADGTPIADPPTDANAIERSCVESCGELEPGPEARDGSDTSTGE